MSGPRNPGRQLKVLIVAPEPVVDPERIAGTTIRALRLAEHLAPEFNVAITLPEGSADPGVPHTTSAHGWTRSTLADLAAGYDVVVTQSNSFPARTWASPRGGRPRHVIDLYSPFWFEVAASNWWRDAAEVTRSGAEPSPAGHLPRLVRLLARRADYVLCATPQQRDLYLGAMLAAGRLAGVGNCHHKTAFQADSLIGIVPFGHDAAANFAPSDEPALRGVVPGISPQDSLLLWGGGIWDWMDPLTLIEAMAELDKRDAGLSGDRAVNPAPKLVFLGTDPPNVARERQGLAHKAIELAAARGLLDRVVFFLEGWMPLSRRANCLKEADLAVCTAPGTLENHFSYRTRLADAIWAGLPWICTEGGFFGDCASRGELGGAAVPPGDVRALALAISETLRDRNEPVETAQRQSRRDDLAWEHCVEPLRQYCRRVEQEFYGGGEKVSSAPEESQTAAWLRYVSYKIPAMIEARRGR